MRSRQYQSVPPGLRPVLGGAFLVPHGAFHHGAVAAWNEAADRAFPPFTTEVTMTEKNGHGSTTARKANAKASREGKSNPRKSSAAQAELGKKGGKSK